jgi:hypothetical protein
MVPPMTERRYSDEEVAAIFREAAEGQRTGAMQRNDDGGLTLGELQSIGREVGLAPDVVTRAALALELRPQAASETFLALPIGVERTITLERTLTDAEWEELVGELRATFRAKGKMAASGRFREWTNGNLHALLEPTATGHRLRLRTLKGGARGALVAGIATLGGAAVVWSAGILAGRLGPVLPSIAMLTILGVGMIAFTALQLPAWARLRGRQMDTIATRIAQSTRLLAPGDAPPV